MPPVKRATRRVTTTIQPSPNIFATMLQTQSGISKIADFLAAPVILTAGAFHAPISDQNKQFTGKVDRSGAPCGWIGGQYLGCSGPN